MLELKEKQKNDFRIVQSNPPISMVRYSRLDGEITFTGTYVKHYNDR